MISAEFIGRPKRGFRISGHADYADYGSDVVCASVSSASMLTLNAITEILKLDAKVTVDKNEICLSLNDGSCSEANSFIEALFLHLNLLAQDYPQNIKVILIVTEV